MHSFFSNIRPALLAEFGGASPTAFQSALAGIFEQDRGAFLDLASRNVHHAHGITSTSAGRFLGLRIFGMDALSRPVKSRAHRLLRLRIFELRPYHRLRYGFAHLQDR